MWYLTIHRYVRPREEGRYLLDTHFEWNFRQQQAGRLLFSGPTPDGQIGIMVLRADSREEAEALIREEPFIKHGFRTYELFEWEVHQVLGVGPFTRESLERSKEEQARLRAARADGFSAAAP